MTYSEMKMEEIQEKLSASTPADQVEWLPKHMIENPNGKTTALALAHCDARFTQNRLDDVVGCLNWQTQAQVLGGLFMVGIGIRDPQTNEWVWKWDTGQDDQAAGTGAGGGKGIVSGGIKRAGYQWGIGRDLYDYPRLRLTCNTWTDRSGKVRFSDWAVSPWEMMDKGKGESPETTRPHRSRVDTKQTKDEEIKPDATTYYDICYGKLKLSNEEAKSAMQPFINKQSGKTDWDKAILAIELNMPESDRAYTIQEKEKADAQGNSN